VLRSQWPSDSGVHKTLRRFETITRRSHLTGQLVSNGSTVDTDAAGAIDIAFGIARSELPVWEAWLAEQGILIELRKTWKYGGEALYFRDPDGHLLESIF
jgi:catechol 2,3-dioxygenase-like lactoylglutathione lyase family enzyme